MVTTNDQSAQAAQWQAIQNQMQQMQDQMTDFSGLFNSGGVIVAGNDPAGYARSLGGKNRYGEARPDYTLMRDPETGALHQNFQQQLGSANQQLLDEAQGTGDTAWAQAQRQLVEGQQGQARDMAAQQGAAAQAQARQGMSMRGGMRSGAAERMAMGGGRNLMNQQQQINQAGNQAQLGISAQDAQTKQRMLGQLGNTQQTIQQGNIQRLAGDIQGQNAFNYGIYGEDMAAYGAQQSANAQAASNQGGGGLSVICTALNKRKIISDRTLTKCNLYGAKTHRDNPDWFKGYLFMASPLVKLMDRNKLAEKIMVQVFTPWAKYIAGDKTKIGTLVYGITFPYFTAGVHVEKLFKSWDKCTESLRKHLGFLDC